MRTSLIVLAIAAMAAANVITRHDHRRVADKDLLVKQQHILQLVVRVHQPNMYHDIAEIGKNYDIEANINDYKNVKAVKEFLHEYKSHSLLPRGEVFSVYYKVHREQAQHLFDVFYYAKDYETFFKSAAWARDHVNEGQFVYALSVAMLAREDTKDLLLPPPYEILPHMFFNNELIQRAYEGRMEMEPTHTEEHDNVLYIYSNKTHSEHEHETYEHTNYEEFLTYFTEDIGLATFNTYWHMHFPSWINSKEYGVTIDRRGELFAYVQRQLLARYNLERLSNDLDEVEAVDCHDPELPAFNPALRYQNGKDYPVRSEHAKVHSIDLVTIDDVQDYERRVKAAIDLGYIITKDEKHLPLTEEKGMSLLGDIIAAYGDSSNREFYGSIYNQFLALVGHIVDPHHHHDVAPGALEHFETQMRDPAYYMIVKRVDNLIQRFQKRLPHYTHEKLAFAGVKIESIEIDKLITYFDHFDVDLDNAVNVGKLQDGEHVDIRARMDRLNHKPFTYRVEVNSDKAVTAMVRVFLGLRYDEHDHEVDINTVRLSMVELDRFPYKLQAGKSTIERNSRDSTVTVKDPISTRALFRKVDDAIQGKEPLYIDQTERQYGYPDRLLLPKGRKEGLPLALYVVLSHYEEVTAGDVKPYDHESVTLFGAGFNFKYPDNHAIGYPFDRPIDKVEFDVPNIECKDVYIFHKTQEEINTSQH